MDGNAIARHGHEDTCMKLFYSLLLMLVMAFPAGPANAAGAGASAEQQSLHVLNRIAYGPGPGDVARVAQMGVKRYIEIQLDPASMAYPAALAERLGALDMANRSAGEALAQFVELRRDVRNEEEGAKKRRGDALQAMTRQSAEARLVRAI
ncbi:MAG: DUF1800 family protein, partial [Massilia sp.]|nr:DUF1800 family protein [Massilia sp.]